MSEETWPASDIPRPAEENDQPAVDDATAVPVATRIFEGACGRVVLTVQAATPEHTRMLARVCAAGLEAAVLRAYGEHLQRY